MEPLVDAFKDLAALALTWLPLLFLGLIVYLIWRTVQLMPRVKPNLVEPESQSAVSWDDIAGVDEAAAELQDRSTLLIRVDSKAFLRRRQ